MASMETTETTATTHIILLLMVKNESRIIERCLQGALPHVDAVAILDTGSTDETMAIAERVLTASGKPGRIIQEPFLDFGKSRTRSFQVAQELCAELEWNPDVTYALAVDGDMVLMPSSSFRSYPLTLNGYSIIQNNGFIKYHNMRLMKCAYPWKCVGATHEYWSGDPTGKIPYDVVYIDDRNDGGCKADKFERDVRLLTAEIAEDPNNGRAHFYLGQSLKDLGRFDEAIAMYTRRIELGGWHEEVWYAHLQIGKCYEHKGDVHQMELWLNKAFDRHPARAEPIYHLCRYFREKSQHYKAYHYYLKGKDIPYPKDDVLFIEDAIYNGGLFAYENTILACYVTGKSKQDALVEVIQYLNRPGGAAYEGNVRDNLVYYLEPLMGDRYRGMYSRLLLPDDAEYKASSCCVVPYSATDPMKRYVLNARMTNYSIDHTGAYHMRSPDGHVKTRNARVWLNAAFQPTESLRMVHEAYDAQPSNIEGLEDIRLFYHDGVLKCTASCKNITNDGRIVIVYGEYDPLLASIRELQVLEPPRPSYVEKNWIYVPNRALISEAATGRLNFIYGWSPLEVGAVDPVTKQLVIHTTHVTNEFFRHCRGSSPLCEYGGKWWCVVHFVKYSQPRQYYHSVVCFHQDTLAVEKYSAPFVFCEPKIEYCLGLDVKDERATFLFSRNDTDPSMIQLPLSALYWRGA